MATQCNISTSNLRRFQFLHTFAYTCYFLIFACLFFNIAILSWIIIGRTDAEAEAPILWPPDAKSWFIGKDPDAGKDLGQKEKGTTEDEMVGWYHRLNGHEFGLTPRFMMNGQAWHAVVHRVAKSRTCLSEWTELNWTQHWKLRLVAGK